MAVELPPDLNQRVLAYLGPHGFESAEEVLRNALDTLEERGSEKLRRWQEGNRLAMEQSRQGLSKPLDDEVLSRLRSQLASEGIHE